MVVVVVVLSCSWCERRERRRQWYLSWWPVLSCIDRGIHHGNSKEKEQ